MTKSVDLVPIIDLPQLPARLAAGERFPELRPSSLALAILTDPLPLDYLQKAATPHIPTTAIAAMKGISLAGLTPVQKATPEMLVAVIASIIAHSRNAVEACVRIRAEVAAWVFQTNDGRFNAAGDDLPRGPVGPSAA
jgi:hypothetical protein